MDHIPGPVRVRIAPGPTGSFHIGRSRTALLNWLFARHHGGVFVLRIEDTDRKRSKPEHLQSILDSLRWLGLHWDEGPDVGGPHEPYFQMGRLETYARSARQLLEAGDAYECYCTPEELEAQRERARDDHQAFRYPRTCRNLSEAERAERRAQNNAFVLRLKLPLDGSSSFRDMLLGDITVQNEELDDFVIVKSDGIPTYNFAVVIDDVTMNITHVIRGQEHIPNTPRQLFVYQYLRLQPPVFAHLPMVLGMDRSKLSARHGAEPVTVYGDDGFLPEAVLNYLATLGASYEDEREIFTRDELIELFDLGRLSKAGAAFSDEKLEWMNGVHLRLLPLEEFVRRSLPYLQIRNLVSTPPTPEQIQYATRALALEQERVRTLAETPDAVEFFFQENLLYDPALLIVKKSSRDIAMTVLHASLQILDRIDGFTPAQLEQEFRALTEQLGVKAGPVFGTIRVAITGRTAAPPLFDTLSVLGPERARQRLRKALHHLESYIPPEG